MLLKSVIDVIFKSPIKPGKDENSPRTLGSNHLAQPEHNHPLVLPQSLDTEEVTDGEGDDEGDVAEGSEEVGEEPENTTLRSLLILRFILHINKGGILVGLFGVSISEGGLVTEIFIF